MLNDAFLFRHSVFSRMAVNHWDPLLYKSVSHQKIEWAVEILKAIKMLPHKLRVLW